MSVQPCRRAAVARKFSNSWIFLGLSEVLQITSSPCDRSPRTTHIHEPSNPSIDLSLRTPDFGVCLNKRGLAYQLLFSHVHVYSSSFRDLFLENTCPLSIRKTPNQTRCTCLQDLVHHASIIPPTFLLFIAHEIGPRKSSPHCEIATFFIYQDPPKGLL